MAQPLSFLCIATYFKGEAFLKACKVLGNTVYLLTDRKLADQPWPHDAIDDIFYLPANDNSTANLDTMLLGLSHTMRSRQIDRVVALDDFDVEKAALIRETFRIDGMGQTTAATSAISWPCGCERRRPAFGCPPSRRCSTIRPSPIFCGQPKRPGS